MAYLTMFVLYMEKRIREMVLKRDNYKCLICGKNNVMLSIHHKDLSGNWYYLNKKVHITNNNMDNLMTVCNSCHGKIHNEHFKRIGRRYYW